MRSPTTDQLSIVFQRLFGEASFERNANIKSGTKKLDRQSYYKQTRTYDVRSYQSLVLSQSVSNHNKVYWLC